MNLINHCFLFLRNRIFFCLLLLSLFQLHIYFKSYDHTYNYKKTKYNNIYYIKYKHSFIYPDPHLPHCSYKKYNLLKGNYTVNLSSPSIETIESLYSNIEPGGHHYPKFCKTKHKVAIVVPYKNRENHLRIFLHNIHNILQRQYIDYIIFLVEPIGNVTFNRGKLINIGYVEALKQYNFNCFILHDVDLIPENDKNIYKCTKYPRHMTSHINKFNYTLYYENHFGGAVAFKIKDFKRINGFNNHYWGWGYEDDDLYNRLKSNNMVMTRYPPRLSRYFMPKHERDSLNPTNPCKNVIYDYFLSKIHNEGLNSLEYKLIKVEYHKLFTKIIVDVLEESSRKMLNETVLKNVVC
uniref:Beta-1,4-N-acetylgalactosaminyltransferase n=1 Tax=Parastrongyloides trichosuri TaxID=131310 RepID=A0A0N4ZGW0_PARTI